MTYANRSTLVALILSIGIAASGLVASAAAETPAITIVAAENMYGDLAAQIAGPHATVVSILSNPDQDPHLFEASVTTAKAVARSRIVIANGAGYDPWMDKLLAASPASNRSEIVAADLMGRKAGDNPHLWYDPQTMRVVAETLAEKLGGIDTAHKAAYLANAKAFIGTLQPVEARIATMRATYGHQPVTATEPVFGLMAAAIGLNMRNERFQTAVMNDTEPSAGDVAAFEDDLRGHKVRALLYNSQAEDEAVKRLVGIARDAHVPVVGVTETEPEKTSYAAWMLGQLNNLETALAGGRS